MNISDFYAFAMKCVHNAVEHNYLKNGCLFFSEYSIAKQFESRKFQMGQGDKTWARCQSV